MKLLIATHNNGKVQEISKLFSRFYDDIVTLKDLGIAFEVEETGATFGENARLKALGYAARVSGCDVLADDSGLEVDALSGAPGVFSARYSGENAIDASNNALLLERMGSVPDEKRRARFQCCVALARGNSLITASGSCEGVILRAPRGSGGFGYDPLFYVEQFGKTFAELSLDEKNEISHRSRALRALEAKLRAWDQGSKITK